MRNHPHALDTTSEALTLLDHAQAVLQSAAAQAARERQHRLAGDLRVLSHAVALECEALFDVWLRALND